MQFSTSQIFLWLRKVAYLTVGCLLHGCGSELTIDGQSVADNFSDPKGAASHIAPIDRANAVEVFTSLETETLVRWRRIEHAVTYDVSISRDLSCRDLLETKHGVSQRSASLPPLEVGVYYACLFARNKAGNIIAQTFEGYEFEVDASLL